MPQSIRLILRAAVWTLGLYGLLWLLATVWVGDRPGNMDSERGLTNIYRSDVREFLYHLPAFCETARGKHNLIIVGGSTASAYDPAIIAPYAKGWTVSRVALDFGNITQMRQTVTLLRECLGQEGFAGSRIVLGVSYVSMATDAKRFPTPFTMLELEQKRHGLFTGEPGALRPTVAWEHMDLAITAGRPVFLAHYLVTGAKDVLAEARKTVGRLRGHSPASLDRAAQEAEAVAYYDDQLEPDPAATLQDQGAELAALVAEIRAAGADLEIVAIPEKAFVAHGSRHIGAYYDWLDAFARVHGITVLRHLYSDADFRDGAHATSEGAARWSRSLAPALAATLPAVPGSDQSR